MDNLNLLCQTIRFQRNALQNSLAMINAVQQHGEKLLRRTLEQSPWIPGEGRDACLYWTGLWRKNLAGMSDLVDKNLATMERLTSTAEKPTGTSRPEEQPAAAPMEPSSGAVSQAAPEKQPSEEQPQAEKETPPPTEQETALVKTHGPNALVSQPPPGKKSEAPPGKTAEKKKTAGPKS